MEGPLQKRNSSKLFIPNIADYDIKTDDIGPKKAYILNINQMFSAS